MKQHIQIIEYIRKERKMSISEFCRRTDYRRSAYYRTLRGESSPSTDTFFKMLDVLEVDFKYVKREK